MRIFPSVKHFQQAVGSELGWSGWVSFDQDEVDEFGKITGADDWIHTDPDRAAEGPFGASILQGDLILSAVPRMLQGIYRVDGVEVGMIYGRNKVRLPSAVEVGTPIRAHAHLADSSDGPRGTIFTIRATVWAENHERPSLVADLLHLLRG